MPEQKQRDSNLELLRIIGMLAITAYHFQIQSPIASVPPDSPQSCLAWFFGGFGRAGVDVFVLIGAWFLIDMPFRSIRFVRLYLTTLFYTVTVSLTFLFLGLNTNSIYQQLSFAFLPFSSASLWFSTSYLFLLFMTPFLNLFIQTLSPRLYRVLYWFLIIVFIVLMSKPGVSARWALLSDTFFFLVIYLIVGYWKKVQEPFLANRTRALQCTLVLIAGCAMACTAIYLLSGHPGLVKVLRKEYVNMTRFLNSVFCFGLASSLFFLFRSFSFSSSIINRIAKNLLGVYILPSVPCLIPFVWRGFHVEKWWNTPYFLLGALGTVLAVFFGSWLIDCLREWLMSPIYRTGWMKRFLAKVDSFFMEELKS